MTNDIHVHIILHYGVEELQLFIPGYLPDIFCHREYLCWLIPLSITGH